MIQWLCAQQNAMKKEEMEMKLNREDQEFLRLWETASEQTKKAVEHMLRDAAANREKDRGKEGRKYGKEKTS